MLKFFCCTRPQSPKLESQTARRVTRPAWTAEVQACGTALFVQRSSCCLMMAAAWVAVEMSHGAKINQSPGSAATARPHKVNKSTLWNNDLLKNTHRSLRPLTCMSSCKLLFYSYECTLYSCLFPENAVYVFWVIIYILLGHLSCVRISCIF